MYEIHSHCSHVDSLSFQLILFNVCGYGSDIYDKTIYMCVLYVLYARTYNRI